MDMIDKQRETSEMFGDLGVPRAATITAVTKTTVKGLRDVEPSVAR
jgi:hypothetical protein